MGGRVVKHLRTLVSIADVAKTGSIRRSAERLNITPSALTRKIQDFEQELGTPLFERLPQGMRLNAAGELVIRHLRGQLSDFERVRSQIADLSGVRRGHVAVACSQAFAHQLLPEEIEAYRSRHPLVSFTLQVRDHADAVAALIAFEADLALVVQPPPAPELDVLLSYHLPLCAVMSADHPLAGVGAVRLRDCLAYPIAMPDRSLAIRHLLDTAIARASLPVSVALESGSLEFLCNYARREHVISFQILGGIPNHGSGLIARDIHRRDLDPAQVILGQLRGRSLSVAAAKFVDQIWNSLHQRHGWGGGVQVQA